MERRTDGDKPDEGNLPETLLVLMILAVSPLATMSLRGSLCGIWLTALVLALPFIYVMIVMKVNEEPDASEKKRMFRIYVSFFLVLTIIIAGYQLYDANWPSDGGSIIGGILSRMYLIFAGIQSICILIVNLFVKRHAANPHEQKLRVRLWLSILMVLVSPLNLLLYVLLFFQGT